tara:strand:- start:155 stop:343 length:189 start_codon:yes stop_codon:yes gene_type:complete
MKKLIFLPFILLFHCAPVAVLGGCSFIVEDDYIPAYEVPTTTDGRGATRTAESTTSTSTTGT